MDATYITFTEFGSPQHVLKVEKRKVPSLDHGEVLVRMIASPINPSDLIPITGAYAHRTLLPAIPGYEGVGIVEEVGPSVSQELLGKRVLPLRGEGTWQEFVIAPAAWIVPIPDFMDDFIAAQLYINPVTAWIICTEILSLTPDDTLLINAGGSAISRIFAQLAKILGFRLIAVTRSHDYTEELLQLGASNVIHAAETSLSETVMELTIGRGASAAIDSIGGSEGTELALCTRPYGTFLSIGLLSGVPVNYEEIKTRNTTIHNTMFHLRHWNQQVTVQKWQETFNHLIAMIADERLRLMQPVLCYHLLDVKKAIRDSKNMRSNNGKIFLVN